MGDENPHDDPISLDVDGEMFSVASAEQQHSYHYTWLSGPNHGYGFTSRGSHPGVRTLEEHRRSIRDFLAMVDPRTGHIEDPAE